MHVRPAGESACIGPPPASGSYLNIPAMASAAELSDASALHRSPLAESHEVNS